MSDIIKPSVLIVEGILKDVVMKKAIVTSSSTPARESANLLKEPPPPPRKSKSNIFENTGELCAEDNRSSFKHRDHSEFLKLEKAGVNILPQRFLKRAHSYRFLSLFTIFRAFKA